MPKRKAPKRRAQRPLLKKCFFCENKKEPSVTEPSELSKFVSERGRILPRLRSGLCAKHQRGMSKQIKRARELGVLEI